MRKTGLSLISFMIVLAVFAVEAEAVWFDIGNGICVEPFSQSDATVASDGAGGAIIVWSDLRNGFAGENDIYAQRISSEGESLWSEGGVAVCTASGLQGWPVALPDGQGGVIVYWWDDRADSYPYSQIYAQRLDAAGNRLWTSGGILVSGMIWYEFFPGFAVDDEGNSYFSWAEDIGDYNIVAAQKISLSGDRLWGSTGTVVCDSLDLPHDFAISPAGDGGAVVAWSLDHNDAADSSRIFAQRVDLAGSILWDDNGIEVFEEPGKNSDLFALKGNAGSMWLVWRSYGIISGSTKTDLELDMAYIDPVGNISGGPGSNSIALNDNFLSHPELDVTDLNELVVVWSEDVSGSQRVFAQKIDTMGNHVWNTGGISVCPEIGDQVEPALTGDGLGGHIVSWTDIRSGNINIYAQRIDGDGDIQWGIPGMPVCTVSGVQEASAIATDMSGGAIIAWTDNREVTHSDIYAGKIGADGGMVPSLLQNWSVRQEEAGLMIRWSLFSLPAAGSFVVERTRPDDIEEAGESGWSVIDRFQCETGAEHFTYLDNTILPGETYRYRVLIEESDGRAVLFESGEIEIPPLAASLSQNRPNPFNPSTTIDYYLPGPASVEIDIYDAAGRKVTRIAGGIKSAGPHTAVWSGRDDNGDAAASGVYFYILRAGKETLRRKMVLLR